MYKAPANNGVQQTKTFFPLWSTVRLCLHIGKRFLVGYCDSVHAFMYQNNSSIFYCDSEQNNEMSIYASRLKKHFIL